MQISTMSQSQSKRQINWIGIVLLTIFVGPIVFSAAKRLGLYNQRAINKRYINPWMLKRAGRGSFPQAIINHVGRKSGQSYTTPVIVVPIEHGFVVPLTYGTHVDWCRNILANGSCTIQWHDTTYKLFAPEIVAIDAIISQFSPFWQVVMRITGHKQALKLKLSTDHVDYTSTVSA